ncbi:MULTISPECIES: hypothetical protein [Bacillus]|uniref:Uncharacterized protein n=2 Tax=Bacillus TaxID=1386 RepID=A0A0M4FXI4_9BACI|nr:MULTISPECIES: hypothetical protein [Bacillus]ALC83680.1 hypothetical protein AM592_20760 [Bacillus gobiensis]MBP1082714.1 hypothetical protein [Bacillus capparidis]MED1097067.1 hypothetical protein [Bacillus capparidis]
MKILASHRCFEVRQEIGWVEKRTVESSFDINLFEDGIAVKADKYPLESVWDVSYRKKGNFGFLYLHTSRGVRSYLIKEAPDDFINAYKKLKSDNPDLF